MPGAYDSGLDRNPANHQPLTPIVFLERAAIAHPDHVAVIHGGLRRSYAALWARCRRLASALAAAGVGHGDTVSVILPNTPPMIEAHFGVPMAGAVLHAVNTRLDATAIAFQLDHAETRVLIVDREFADVARAALALARVSPLLVSVDDPEHGADAPYPKAAPLSGLDYEDFVASGRADDPWRRPRDEWDAIALNYTSGTTGNPKGAVYHHRGAALMCYANTINAVMDRHPVFLWTQPMFHCNGWCFPWAVTVQAGTHVCLRWVRARPIYDAIADLGVTHLCGAPIIMTTLMNAPEEERRPLPRAVRFNVSGAPPPEAVIEAMGRAGFIVNHLYGLTESFGPAVVNPWHAEWDALPEPDQAVRRARQGVRGVALDGLAVLDPQTMAPVPADGETLGEVMLRGNIVMKGYLKNPAATAEAFAGGWFHTGDLGVTWPDGYVQLKDRSKDIIISGGENISSIEVENAIYSHPDVLLCAVIAAPSEKWGETPVAYVEMKPGRQATAAEIIDWCRRHLARFKCPTEVVFMEIPRTATGKVQKFRLREMIRAG